MNMWIGLRHDKSVYIEGLGYTLHRQITNHRAILVPLSGHFVEVWFDLSLSILAHKCWCWFDVQWWWCAPVVRFGPDGLH